MEERISTRVFTNVWKNINAPMTTKRGMHEETIVVTE